MKTAYNIAVLITCHNRREKTISCLKELYNCDLPENHFLDVFLVDDGSSDGTSQAIINQFDKVNLIEGDGTLFWNRGMLLAWESAIKKKIHDYYLWLNDDTLLFKNALEAMLNYSHSVNNQRIIVGATCSRINGKITYSGYNAKNRIIAPNGFWQDCDHFNGNIVLIPSFVYNKVGLLDNKFRHTLGDFDYGMRASKIGFIHALSANYLGTCEEHEADPIWRNHSFKLTKRLKHLYTPLGNNPIEFFIFDIRHNGLFNALVHFLTIHLRTLFPSLWKKQ